MDPKLTEEADAEGQDVTLASDPTEEQLQEGVIEDTEEDADSADG